MPYNSAMMEMFSICAVQYGSHQPHVAIQHLQCGWCNTGAEYLILFHFHSFKFKSLHLCSGCCMGQCSLGQFQEGDGVKIWLAVMQNAKPAQYFLGTSYISKAAVPEDLYHPK